MLNRRDSGLALVEVVVALAILVVVALGLIAAIASSQRLTNLAREKAIAMNAVRAYIEAMRAHTAAEVFADTTTPADYVPTNTLVSASGEVFKIDYEDGSHGARVTGTPGSVNALSMGVTFTDGASLACPRDLDGNGTTTGSPVAGSPGSLVVLPSRIKLSWTSATGGTQSWVVYACFTNP